MQRHRVRESQDWMGSLSLSHECRTVVLPMGNWPAEKWWQQTSVHVCVLNRVRLFATPRTVARQAPRPWDSPGNNTGVPCYFLLQELFPTQGLNSSLLYLLHWQVSFQLLVPPGKISFWVTSSVILCWRALSTNVCFISQECLQWVFQRLLTTSKIVMQNWDRHNCSIALFLNV